MSQNRFKTKTPVSNKPSGMNIKDVLAFAAGKESGSLTTADIDAVISKAGIRGKDAKGIRKAAANFVGSGNQYMLSEDGNYNVYGDGEAKTSSSRSTGNKVGFNAGDVVGLGNNMAKLAGLAKMYSSAFAESKKPKVPVQKESSDSSASAAPASTGATQQSQSARKSAGKKSTGKGVKPADLVKGPSADFESKIQSFHDKYNSTKTSEAPAKKPRTTPGMGSEGNLIWGDLIKAFDPNTYKRLGIAWNPTQFWDEEARERARTMAREDKEEMQPTRDEYERIQREGTLMEKLFTPNPDIESAPMPNMGIFTPSPTKLASPLQWLKGRMASKVKMPAVTKKPLQIPQKASPPPPKRISTTGEKAPELKKGGKIYADGGKVKPADLLGDEYWKNFNANLGKNIPQMAATPTTVADTGVQPGQFQSADLSGANGGNGMASGEGKGLAAFGKVAKYTLPFIGTHLANRELGKVKSVTFKPANLMAGVVADLPKPNMGLRYRTPTGNDVQSEIAGQKFADAQQRDAEVNYNIANAQSRIAQQQQVVNNLNRNISYNNQGENNARFFNANQLMNIQAMKSQNVQEPFIAAQHHLATDISTDAYLKSSEEMQNAEMILKTADPNSPEYREALRKMGYGAPKGKKGMKFKIAK